ncbi:MAG: PIN domain-containing protein [Pseudomonadota bacterium]
MSPVFIDTGGWIAMAVVRDRYHRQAAEYYRKISKGKTPLVTSNYVLVEAYTRIRYDDGHAKAVRFHSLIQDAVKIGRLRVEWVNPAIHADACSIFKNYSDQVFSLVDCTSFVIANHAGTKEIFGFDQNFSTMGFVLRPEPA